MGNWKAKRNMMPMCVSLDEMVPDYRQAKNKGKQIDIFAECVGTSPYRIGWLLRRCGLAVPNHKLPSASMLDTYIDDWMNSPEAEMADRIYKRLREEGLADAQEEDPFCREETEGKDTDKKQMQDVLKENGVDLMPEQGQKMPTQEDLTARLFQSYMEIRSVTTQKPMEGIDVQILRLLEEVSETIHRELRGMI